MFLAGQNRYTANQDDFAKIPGMPVAYWASDAILNCFLDKKPLDSQYKMREGIHTADNERFLRLWYEVNWNTVVYEASS